MRWVVFFLGGDMATTRRYLDLASRASIGLLDSDIPITPININCLDPLGRSALSIGSFFRHDIFHRILISLSLFQPLNMKISK